MTRFAVLLLGCAAWNSLLIMPIAGASKAPTTRTANLTNSTAAKTAWPAETLNGTIVSFDPTARLLIVDDSNGVPFDMVVTAKTHIMSGNQSLTLNDLEQDRNKSVSIQFVPETRGDFAQSVRITG